MTGGNDQKHNTLNDAWLMEVNSGRWREVREGRCVWDYDIRTLL